MGVDTRISDMVKELLDYDGESGNREMTDWEVNFVEDLKETHVFSPKQIAKVEEVWQEIYK